MRKKRRIVSDTYEGNIRNVGLVETINRAAGSLQKDQNLNDIPDKVKARTALQLGTAATVDVTTSTTDKTPSRVPTVGWMGNGISIALPENSDLNNFISVVATYSVNSIGASPKNFPINKPGVLRVSQDSDNRTIQEYTTFNPVVKYERALYSSGTWSAWSSYYSTNNKPTSSDVGAIQKDPIGTIVNNGTMASANTPGWWVVSVANPDTVADFPTDRNGGKLYGYGFMFVARSGDVWLQQYFTHHGMKASRQTWNGDMSVQTAWVVDYNAIYKPTAGEVGALPITGGAITGPVGIGTENALGGNSIALGDNDTGFKQNGDGVLDVYSNSRQVMRIVPGAVQIFGSTGSWIYMREQICFSSVTPVDKDGASAIVRQEHPDRHFILGGLGNHQFGIYMINKSRTENGTDGQAYLDENGNWVCGSQIIPGNYGNFDARYQPRDNYATQAWVLQNFVQNIDLTAPAEVGFRDGWGYPRGTDGAAMYNFNMVGGSSNVGNFIVRYTRKLVNNTWYVIN
ncbi:pyocin knob domain-containing protein [Citrobacter braakii]|uniref:pyocin knob domain-containing protein n=1 Tax=Citrobacter braakii TaxID=57706 RepID=UPI001C7D1E27|nr:pyocin knob domain-containing protein [Citrobacter braakii]